MGDATQAIDDEIRGRRERLKALAHAIQEAHQLSEEIRALEIARAVVTGQAMTRTPVEAAIIHILQEAKTPLSPKQVTEKVREVGVATTNASVRTTLSVLVHAQKYPIVRCDRGQYQWKGPR